MEAPIPKETLEYYQNYVNFQKVRKTLRAANMAAPKTQIGDKSNRNTQYQKNIKLIGRVKISDEGSRDKILAEI